MNQELSKKTYAILYWNEDWDWVSEEEAEVVKSAMKRGDKFIEMDGELSMISAIARVVKGSKMESITYRKNGYHQCRDCGRWTPPKMVCGCQGGKF
jgi:hypothetical protein